MQMTNCASRLIGGLAALIENPLDLVFFRPNPVGFIPVDFRMAYRTIRKLHLGCTFQLPPACLAVGLPQPLTFADCFAGSDQLYIGDSSDDFEMHASAPLRSKEADRSCPPH